MFKRILLAVDGSEYSVRSTKYAISLVEQFHGTLDVVYVVDSITEKEGVVQASSEIELDENRNIKLKPIMSLLDDAGIDYDSELLHGEVAPEIVDFADENANDCIVIGSRGLSNIKSFVLGSVSHKVAKKAECPVLIVK